MRRSKSASPSSSVARRRRHGTIPRSPAAVPAGFFVEQPAAPPNSLQTQQVEGGTFSFSFGQQHTADNQEIVSHPPPVFGATSGTKSSPTAQPSTTTAPVFRFQAGSCPAGTTQSHAPSALAFGSGTRASLAAQLPTLPTAPVFGSSAGDSQATLSDTSNRSAAFVFQSTIQSLSLIHI